MYKIQTLNKISPKGLELFPRENYEVASEIPHPDAILLRSFKMHDLELSDSLKAVGRAGAGVNNIPIEKCTARGIPVFNTPGANANSVKELALMALFISSRKIVDGIIWARHLAGQGAEVPREVEKEKSRFSGPEIRGKKLGVIGLGAIGVMVANDAEALGMKVSGFDPFISVDSAWGLSRTVKKAASLDTLIAQSDYITVHVPLDDKTKGLINREKFALMKKGVRLLNFSRGGLVNNTDLKEALADGTLAAYVTDFPDEDLIGEDNVIPVPHLGASTPEAEDNCAIMAVNQVRDFLEYGNISNSVNFPECNMAPSASNRILVDNRNVPNMGGQITTLLAETGINIVDMLNRSRGDLAHNIIDCENGVTDEVLTSIYDIEGVIMTRLIKIE